MKIELKEISIKDVAKEYKDNSEEGIIGFSGKLNIRPKYQREFVYDDKKRNAVIETIIAGFPLNVMYWAKNNDGSFELMDGQQRTVSFCQYINGEFSLNNRAFHNLTETEKNRILNYKLMIYFCEGNDKEKLDWFRIINIAGEKLTDQELRNAIYTGEWLTHAKSIFSKSNCAAYLLSKDYVNGSPIRQDFLETAISWINEDKIEEYMSKNQHEQNANEIWLYYQKVINWIKITFPKYRKEMKGINWGVLYNFFHSKNFNTKELENKVNSLMSDDDVTNKKGAYFYVLNGEEKYLNIRSFTDSQKRTVYERQKGNCFVCKKNFEIEQTEADHITPWSKGGKTSIDNCNILCKECNRRKSNI
jgi:hypothetical protein